MPFNDESLTDLARTQSAIGALHVVMDTLSFTGDGIPTEAHYLLAELEQRERYYFKREAQRPKRDDRAEDLLASIVRGEV